MVGAQTFGEIRKDRDTSEPRRFLDQDIEIAEPVDQPCGPFT